MSRPQLDPGSFYTYTRVCIFVCISLSMRFFQKGPDLLCPNYYNPDYGNRCRETPNFGNYHTCVYELWSKLLKGDYIGDYLGDYYKGY